VRRTPDVASVVAGLAIVAFGAVLMADALGAIELRFEWLAPATFGVLGAILLALGLGRES
jgi:Ca2+/Na+ antiporter